MFSNPCWIRAEPTLRAPGLLSRRRLTMQWSVTDIACIPNAALEDRTRLHTVRATSNSPPHTDYGRILDGRLWKGNAVNQKRQP